MKQPPEDARYRPPTPAPEDDAAVPVRSWRSYADPRALTMLMLGFSAGIPILLIFSSLSLWLSEAGVDRKTVTLFSWAALGYSFKFVWAPLVEVLPVPLLTKYLGQRRGWLLLSQLLVMAAIVWMASVNPANGGALLPMALGAVLLGFSSATQDVVIDAYRVEVAPNDAAMQSVISSTYTAGYRIGLVVAGAGALRLASWFGSTPQGYLYEAWRNTYWIMAAVMGIGVLTTLLIREPKLVHVAKARFGAADNLRLLLMFAVSVSVFVPAFRFIGGLLPEIGDPFISFLYEALRLLASAAAAAAAGWLLVAAGAVPRTVVRETWVAPLADFFRRYGNRALLLLALIGLYRISDIVAGVISSVFYAELGFSKEQIADAVKTFGILMSVAGGFAGGLLAQRYAVMKMMMLGAVLAAATNLLFALLAWVGRDTVLLYLAVGLDNFAAGLAGTVFVAFLSALTNIRFTTVQYALFSSLMTLLPKVLGGYSGGIVDHIGYVNFFILTALLGVPILLLVWLADKKLEVGEKPPQ